MTPTPEEIAEMERRGWAWDPDHPCFHTPKSDAASAAVLRYGGFWRTSYGTPGVNHATFDPHESPLPAADEAEAWLRAEIGKLRFPWLKVEKL